jgi:hypothetical protein
MSATNPIEMLAEVDAQINEARSAIQEARAYFAQRPDKEAQAHGKLQAADGYLRALKNRRRTLLLHIRAEANERLNGGIELDLAEKKRLRAEAHAQLTLNQQESRAKREAEKTKRVLAVAESESRIGVRAAKVFAKTMAFIRDGANAGTLTLPAIASMIETAFAQEAAIRDEERAGIVPTQPQEVAQ